MAFLARPARHLKSRQKQGLIGPTLAGPLAGSGAAHQVDGPPGHCAIQPIDAPPKLIW